MKKQVDEYANLYTVSIIWVNDDKYVVVTSRPRYTKKSQIPKGSENYNVISYSLYNAAETDTKKIVQILG